MLAISNALTEQLSDEIIKSIFFYSCLSLPQVLFSRFYSHSLRLSFSRFFFIGTVGLSSDALRDGTNPRILDISGRVRTSGIGKNRFRGD